MSGLKGLQTRGAPPTGAHCNNNERLKNNGSARPSREMIEFKQDIHSKWQALVRMEVERNYLILASLGEKIKGRVSVKLRF